jgi:hypothetical protein
MNSKTGKEDRSCDDIAFLSEIISNCRFNGYYVSKSKIGQLGAYLQYCRGQENLNYQRLAKQKTGHNITGISIISKKSIIHFAAFSNQRA